MTSLYAYNEPCCESFNSEKFQTYFVQSFWLQCLYEEMATNTCLTACALLHYWLCNMALRQCTTWERKTPKTFPML